MRGSDFLASLPEKYSPEREQMILAAVRRGDYVLNWVPIKIDRGPYSATIWVTSDAVRIGEPGDSVRVAVSAQTEQMIADELNAVMPTAQISDEIYRQADLKLKPVTLGSKVTMSTTSRMKTHHDKVEEQLAPWYDVPLTKPFEELLISPVGKDWVNSRRLLGDPFVQGAPAAINYGWHRDDMAPAAHTGPFPSVTTYPPVVVHQGEGMAHNMLHQDYSQVVRLVARAMVVCVPTAVSGYAGFGGEPWSCESGKPCTLADGSAGVSKCLDIYDVAQDDTLSPLVSHNGPVYMRQFGVPYEEPKGTHSLWGGLPPATPPASKLAAPPKGGVPPEPPVPMPEVAAVGMGARVLSFGVGAAVGWLVADRLSRP